jgi:biopolymer transport protein ExbB
MSIEAFRELLADARGVWLSGGWAMIALAFDGLVMYSLGSTMLLKMWAKGAGKSPEKVWRRWKADPAKVRGSIGKAIAGAMACRSMTELQHYFEGLQNDEVSPFDRDLKVMQVSVAAAPLLGLLGTVTGMLTTFNALATGGGGDKTMGMIASGISEALITTETGLVLALSGLVFQFILTRQHEKFGKLMVHLETLCTQAMRVRLAA